MADVKDLFQMIAGKEVMIFDLNEALKKCREENQKLIAEIDEKSMQKPRGNGDDAGKPAAVESAKSARR